MTNLKTEILAANADGIGCAAQILSSGGLVAFPTETVYGLGVDACNGRAVASVYQAKGRPSFNPLIVHVADLDTAKRFASFNPLALKFAAEFWPGPISLVLPLMPNHGLSELVTAGLDTVAIRVPQHPIARELLRAFNGPIAAPSANPSGQISPTNPTHVNSDMAGKIDAIIEGGVCDVGLESTIIQVDAEVVSLLRAGGISVEQIEALLGYSLAMPDDRITPKSPGQLQSHYAPNAQVRLNATTLASDEVLLGFGPDCLGASLNLSVSGNLIEAAANLFSHLREIDQIAGDKTIAISPIPNSGLGLAINDRLKRASAPRD